MAEATTLIAGILLSAGAQVALKLGSAGGPALPWLATAGLAYGGAFALYFRLLRTWDLSWLSPLMVGGTTLLVVLAGTLLGETLGPARLGGTALILAGLWLLATHG